MKPRYVVLTNTSRGVYFGELRGEDPKPGEAVMLYNARHCFTWRSHPEAKGVWGLAIKGPAPQSQVGPTLPYINVASAGGYQYAPCSEEAVKAWLKATW